VTQHIRLPDKTNRLVGQAMHDYGMLANGDRVLVAVSGGVDSLVLVHLLHAWQRKAPISYQLVAVHVDMDASEQGPSAFACAIRAQLAKNGLELSIVAAKRPPVRTVVGSETDAAGERVDAGVCFVCARTRRLRLFAEARHLACNKIAFGHHQDDLIETFLLNLTCAGNISTMRPRQDLFEGRLALIRPLAYVEKQDIEQVALINGLEAIPSSCPLGERTRRSDMRHLAAEIYKRIPGSKKNMFAALGNVRNAYLLNNGRMAR
jgi:tRNA 2-thiocytidine biosynthesis protein TtcA